MKTIENRAISFKGLPLTDENKKPITTLSLFRTILENSSYDTAGSLMKAIKVEKNLGDEDMTTIALDDADFDFIKKWAMEYKVLLAKGLVFAEFFSQLE